MAVCPLATWRPVQNHSGSLSGNLGLIEHVQEGDNSLADYFNNPGVQASSTFWAAKDGRLEQYVDTDLRAWAQAAGNGWYCSVETEGFSTDPLTDQQIATLARLYQWGHSTHGWPYQLAEQPMDHGFGWHGMGGTAWGGHFDCPGNLRRPQRTQILAAAQGGTPQPSPEDDMTPEQFNALLAAESAPQVHSWYLQYLGRDAGPGDVNAWTRLIRRGTTLDQVEWSIATSPEAQAFAKK